VIRRATWLWKTYGNELGSSHERPCCAVLHPIGCGGPEWVPGRIPASQTLCGVPFQGLGCRFRDEVHQYAVLFQGTDTDVSRIAVIEDEPILARLLERILGGAGHTVTVAGTVAGGLAVIRAVDPDLIVLDLVLPDGRGEDVLAELMRFRPSSRVLVLSSMTQVATRVGVLEGGAVDFLAKPFANAELLARINARVRTPSSAVSVPRYIRRAGVEVDVQQRELVVDGRRISLTQREFVLLAFLLQRAPEPCTRAELLERVWGTKFDTGTNVVDVCVRRLRSKLSTDKIETVRNVGYRITI